MHRALRRGLGALATLAVLLVLAPPAQAHDSLVSSDPQANSEVASPPSQVTLTFSASIGEQFAQVAVTDADGTTYQDGEPVVDGATLTQEVSGLPTGTEITIAYRVVSSDGHPIGGRVPFVIAGTAPAADDTSAGGASSAETGDDVGDQTGTATTDDTAGTASPTPSDEGRGLTPWIGGIAAIAVVGAVGIGVARRRHRVAVDA